MSGLRTYRRRIGVLTTLALVAAPALTWINGGTATRSRRSA